MLRPFNRSVHLLLFTFAITGFAYFGVQAVLFNLYLLRLGFTPQFIGLLIGSGQLLFALVSLPAGALGQRIGVRGAIIGGFSMISLGFAMLLLTESLPRPVWVPWLFLWWAVAWAGAATANVNAVPYFMSTAREDARRAFAMQSTVIALTSFAGNLAGGMLLGVVAGWMGTSSADPAPYRLVQLLTPAAFAVAATSMLAARPVERSVQAGASGRREARPLGLFVFLGLLVFLFTASEGTVRAFFNVYLDTRLGVPPSQIGLAMGLGMLVPISAPMAVPWLLSRFGTAGTLALASGVCALGLVALSNVRVLPVAVLSFMTVMSMVSIHSASRNVFSQEMVGVPWRSTTAAIVSLGMGLGWASAAAVGGQLIAMIDFRGLFLLVSGLASIGAAASWSYLRAQQARRPAGAPANLVASTSGGSYPPN